MSSNRIGSSTQSRRASIRTEHRKSISIIGGNSYELQDNIFKEKRSLKYSIFRKPKSLQEKCLSFGACFLLAFVIVFLTSMWIVCNRWNASLSQIKHIYIEEDDICETEACKKTAERIISNIDPTTDPCTDFYQYACGGWMQKNPIPEGKGFIVAIQERQKEVDKQISSLLKNHAKQDTCKSVRNAGKLFSACMNKKARNENGLKSMQKLINQFGGWPMLGDGLWIGEGYSWYEHAAKVNRELFSDIFVKFQFTQLPEDKSINKLKLDSGYFLFQHEMDMKLFDGYPTRAARDFVVNAARSLGSTLDKTTLRNEALDMIWLEKKLYVASNDYLDDLLYMKVSDLQSNIKDDNFLYRDFINLHLRSKVPIEDDTYIYAMLPNYLKKLPEILAKTNKRTIANYIAFNIFAQFADVSSDYVLNVTFRYERAMNIERSLDLERTCLKYTQRMMTLAVGRLYVDKYFPPPTKLHVTKMLDMIRLAYSATIDQNEWMDEQTLLFSLIKLKSIHSMIFYEDWILENKLLDEYYIKVGDIEEDDFFSAAVALTEIHADLLYSKWNKTTKRTDPDTRTNNPVVVNAFYARNNNFIAIPAGICGYPYYQYGRIDSINYGGIGSLIGHEISHAFDTTGRRFDHEGNKKNWWTNKTEYKYYKREQCFIDQYNNFKDPFSPMKADGKHTLKENIADNGGVKSAFKAFRLHLALSGESLSYRKRLPGLAASPEQLFFLGYASVYCGNMTDEVALRYKELDRHSPFKIRVNLPLSNFKEFAKAFKCKAGTPMNPLNKCSLW